MAKNWIVYIDYHNGTPELECEDPDHHHPGKKIGNDDITELQKDDTVTLTMRGFPGTCQISSIKFYDTKDYTETTTPVGSFTPSATTKKAEISKGGKKDFQVEVKDKKGTTTPDLTKLIITDIEDLDDSDTDNFWYAVKISWEDGTATKTATLDPELINKAGGKGPTPG